MLPASDMKLTIVIPACNEENRIGRMLGAYLPFFVGRYGAEVEFIVVINGTTDGTEAVVRGCAVRWPAVRAVVEPGRIGKGGALVRGFADAQGDLVGFADADGSTPPEAFQDLVDRMGDAGAIIASRWCRGANVSPRQPLKRRMASRAFNLLTRVLFGLRLTDTQCGAKVMRREAIRAVLPHLGTTRWAFDVDLLFQLRRAGYVIREIPTTWRDVEGSGVRVVRTSLEMSVALVRLRLVYSPFHGIVRLYERTIGRAVVYPGA
jgi:glycosyltransferase involved in cell wall biosynthesis